ncbi:hypothetical protein SAMN04488057_11054 [Cyclobacterium lianum]|uniref:Uncharacterized protein n=1 Tax=Cyclobacterium lianum TaxID=388280 RepID=A0A1M7PRD8_9BACT|nr:hypothetical protein [Cyclobacterium lianum]SHN19955.1 hypothetical protein SAMN04488057_11054 [Cyclobacterium lianum]
MKTPSNSSLSACFFMLILLTHHLMVFGQRPPTSGPNPEDSNLTPFVIGGSGLLVAAGSYLYLKSRGPKIPVRDNLQDYLWRENIMPTPDALHLMYALNPGLRGQDLMRKKKKLVEPEFPEIPEDLRKVAVAVPPPTFIMPENLQGLINEFKSILDAFSGMTFKTTHRNAPKEAFLEVLNNLERLLTAPERLTESRNVVKDQLMTDLITVADQTVDGAIDTRELSTDKLALLQAIATDMEDLLYPDPNPAQMQVVTGKGDEESADWGLFLASAGKTFNDQLIYNRISNAKDARENADLKWFALAVYKYGADGELITKGREVENRYQIAYASPALKDREESFHTIQGNASYGTALLGNGKYFIRVKDGDEEVPIQNPLIHFGQAFQNPVKETHNELTKVIIYILE